jgi:hypothetical protein
MKLTRENLRACFTEELKIDYTPSKGGCEKTGWAILAFYKQEGGEATYYGQGFISDLDHFIEDTFKTGEPILVDLKIFKDSENFSFESEGSDE